MRENIAKKYHPPWVDVQEKIFPRNSKECLDEKILKKLVTTQHFIRERELFFLSASVATA